MNRFAFFPALAIAFAVVTDAHCQQAENDPLRQAQDILKSVSSPGYSNLTVGQLARYRPPPPPPPPRRRVSNQPVGPYRVFMVRNGRRIRFRPTSSLSRATSMARRYRNTLGATQVGVEDSRGRVVVRVR